MANLTESPIYEPGIFQLEKTTPPLGGAPAFNGTNPSAGHANVQGLQLANRTAWLKDHVEFTAPGGLTRDLKSRALDAININDYTDISSAITAATTGGFYLYATKSISVGIPSQCPSLQKALDLIVPLGFKNTITLTIETGFLISEPTLLSNGDYSQFRIVSQSGTVGLSSLMPRLPIIKGINSRMPRLACLIDASGYGSDGIFLDNSSSMCIEANSGVTNAYSTGLLAQNGSIASARGSIFTYAARNGTTGAGITSWGGIIDATDADVGFSGYYGAQAAHGGTLVFERGKADDCFRYAIRGSDRGNIDFSDGVARRAGVYGLYSFQNSSINAPGAVVTDSKSANVVATNGSSINFRGGTATGATKTGTGATAYGYNVYASGGSIIDCFNGILTGAAEYGVFSESGSSINAGGSDASNSGNRGYYAYRGSVISAPLGKANNCIDGFYGDQGGRIDAHGASATGCTNAAVVANYGATLDITTATLTGSGVSGVRALNGSKLNVSGSNCRRGVSDDVTDIQCFSGSTISAVGATGGANRTLNTITVQGIIFK